MKLKRCPNLHYYDGDKYATCPHCNASAAKKESDIQEKPSNHSPASPQAIPQQVKRLSQLQSTPLDYSQPANPEPAHLENLRSEPTAVSEQHEELHENRNQEEVLELLDKAQNSIRDSSEIIQQNKASSDIQHSSIEEPFQKEQMLPNPEHTSVHPSPTQLLSDQTQISVELPDEGPMRVPQSSEIERVQADLPQKSPVPFEGVSETTSILDLIHQDLEEKPSVHSLTSEIDNIGFVGQMEDAKELLGNAAHHDSDDSKTTLLLDQSEEGLPFGWLTVTSADAIGKVYPLLNFKSTVGRGSVEHIVDVDLRMDRSVSRGAQAIIIYDAINCKFYLQNANGKTLVYLNGHIVLTFEEIKAYDMIRLGKTELIFVPLCSTRFSWNS